MTGNQSMPKLCLRLLLQHGPVSLDLNVPETHFAWHSGDGMTQICALSVELRSEMCMPLSHHDTSPM